MMCLSFDTRIFHKGIMNNAIHPTAVIHDDAQIGKNCHIGPYCIIGAQVVLADECHLHSHVVIDGDTHIGEKCEIFPFASVGTKPQDLKYNGEAVRLRIGSRNRIREHVTINPGTIGDKALTQIGNDNLLMIGVHVAHDCTIGNGNVFANNATLAGHVHVGDNVVIGGLSAVHQFCRVGDHAMIGGMSGVDHDVIPYGLVMGERAKLTGLNLTGLERRGFEKSDIKLLMKAYKHLFLAEQGTFKERITEVANDYPDNETVQLMIKFATTETSRPLCQAK